MKANTVITIGRQLGSGGLDVARILSEKTGIIMYDRELLYIAAKESGLCPELFQANDEKSKGGRFGFLIGIKSSMYPSFINPDAAATSEESLFNVQSRIISKIADSGSAIFVGRCADYVLRDREQLLSVFITGDLEDRVKRVMLRDNVPEASARKKIEQGDIKRAEYYNYFTFKKWGDSSGYDVCLNSSRFGIEGTVDCIIDILNKIK